MGRSIPEPEEVLPGDAVSRRDFLRRGLVLGATVPLLGGIAAACGSGAGSSTTTSSSPSRAPRRGGDLRVGLTGGSSSENLDANNSVGYPANLRCAELYDPLTTLNSHVQSEYALAEEITSNSAATLWTIRLRSGVKFHNGKDLTADDLIFTFQRIVNPKFPLAGATALGPIDAKNMKKLDSLTVQVPMTAPFASFIDQLADYGYLYIVPVGYDPKNPVGTGPFKYKSATPGVQSDFLRNENYWRSGLPYVDSVTTIDFADDVSMINALTTGEIDAAGNIDGASAKQLASNPDVKVQFSDTGGMIPFTMRVDVPPFNDMRVRQAMRLVLDRPQFIDLVLDGFGAVGNDVFSPYDSCYDHSLKRSQDIDQAKFLLKKAGRENLSVQLVTAPIANGTVQGAEVFVEQAAKAGINVNLRSTDTNVLFGPGYLTWPFSQDFWTYLPYLAQVAVELLPKAPYNETHWSSPKYIEMYNAANAELNPVKRCEIKREMMLIDFNEGGLIIPCFYGLNDAYSAKLSGYGPGNHTGFPFGASSLDNLWFS